MNVRKKMKLSVLLSIIFGVILSLVQAGDELSLPENPSCILEVISISAPIASDSLSEKPIFHRRVELLLKNNSAYAIKFSGYGSDKNPMILHRFQIWDEKTKKWPALKMRGVCGTGLKSFTLAPEGRLKFTVTISAKPDGKKFRFGVVSTDKKHPKGTIIYTKPTKLPNGEQGAARKPPTRSAR